MVTNTISRSVGENIFGGVSKIVEPSQLFYSEAADVMQYSVPKPRSPKKFSRSTWCGGRGRGGGEGGEPSSCLLRPTHACTCTHLNPANVRVCMHLNVHTCTV